MFNCTLGKHIHWHIKYNTNPKSINSEEYNMLSNDHQIKLYIIPKHIKHQKLKGNHVEEMYEKRKTLF